VTVWDLYPWQRRLVRELYTTCDRAAEPRFATFELAAEAATVDVERRTIEGVLVPFGEIGVATIDGKPGKIRYRRGAKVEAARSRTPIVRSHDLDAPVGVLAELVPGDDGIRARFKIDTTPAGDDALAQAASGSRAGLSVAGPLTEYEERGDVIEVAASSVVHVGLVTVPAFASAEVTSVAAESTEGKGGTMDPKQIRKLLGLAEDATDEQVEAALKERNLSREQFEAAHKDAPAADPPAADPPAADPPAEAELPVRHGRKPTILAARGREAAVEPGAPGRYVQAMLAVAANPHNAEARKVVEAALAQVISTDVPGLMPPAYTSAIVGELPDIRPLADSVAVRRPLPESGMKITKPKWTTKPLGGWRADVPGVGETAEIATNKPEVDPYDVIVQEWAYGVALSYAVATRSSPDAIEAIYRLAVADYHSDVEQKIADALMANDQAGVAGAGIGGGFAEFFTDEKQAPDLLVVAPDVFGDLINAEGFLMYAGGSVSANGRGSIAGLDVVVSGHLPAGTELVTARGVIELRETEPIRLTATTIGALMVELGVTSFTTIDVERPNAIHSLTPPVGAPAGASETRRTNTAKTAKGSK
jgi:HK97 family phage prohead protease